uniref:Uncharacterized protein n=1 Tax=Caenorhabditis japonica TaxID=281687 RepID=A0A8R1DQB9_CAEJA
MFLIAKIVRGRRLLHELEKQEKDEHLAADVAAAQQSVSQVRLTTGGVKRAHLERTEQEIKHSFDRKEGTYYYCNRKLALLVNYAFLMHSSP